MSNPWTDEEYGILQDHEDWTARQLAMILNHSLGSIRQKRIRLRKGWSPIDQRERWSTDDDRFLVSTAHMGSQEVATLLGRTSNAVRLRRKILGSVKRIYWGRNGDPSRIGNRPLIAKTCPTCGLLLQAEWFARASSNGRYCGHRSECKRCFKPERHTTRSDRGGRNLSAEMSNGQLQELSLPHASRSGEIWSSSEHEILSDPDLTRLEKAIRLKRTYFAAVTMIAKCGYQSKVGLGDPERDQWIIDNPNADRFAS
jgi:hypothetical protein